MKSSKLCALLATLSLLASCGYNWQTSANRPLLSIPFVKGDEEGFLTAEMIGALSSSGIADVTHKGGDYQLQLAVLNQTNELIGFRRDPQKVDGKVKNNLLACEGRLGMTVEATLYRNAEIIKGPFQVCAEADYDYVDGDSIQDLTFVAPNGQVVTVLPFSLGQLESVESAQEAAARPIYRRLAQKVVDQLSSIW